jgi:hypothetical protein
VLVYVSVLLGLTYGRHSLPTAAYLRRLTYGGLPTAAYLRAPQLTYGRRGLTYGRQQLLQGVQGRHRYEATVAIQIPLHDREGFWRSGG